MVSQDHRPVADHRKSRPDLGPGQPVFDLVAVLVTELIAYVTGEYPLAASTIARHSGEWVQFGGSDAQREVIHDTR